MCMNELRSESADLLPEPGHPLDGSLFAAKGRQEADWGTYGPVRTSFAVWGNDDQVGQTLRALQPEGRAP